MIHDIAYVKGLIAEKTASSENSTNDVKTAVLEIAENLARKICDNEGVHYEDVDSLIEIPNEKVVNPNCDELISKLEYAV